MPTNDCKNQRKFKKKKCMLIFFSTCVCKISQMTMNESWKKTSTISQGIYKMKRIFDKCKDVTILCTRFAILSFSNNILSLLNLSALRHTTYKTSKTVDGFISHTNCYSCFLCALPYKCMLLKEKLTHTHTRACLRAREKRAVCW